MTSNTRKLELYIKNFAYKSVQVISQARQGKRLRTESKPVLLSPDWFNLGVADLPDVQAELKRRLPSYAFTLGVVLSVEVSLRSQDSAPALVELWKINVVSASTSSSQPSSVPQPAGAVELSAAALASAYVGLGKLLRSVCVASRALPAYRLSRRRGQGGERTFLVQVHASSAPAGAAAATSRGTAALMQPSAADGFADARLGSVNLSGGSGYSLTVSVAYRRRLELVPVSLIADDPMEAKTNHFDDSCLGPLEKYACCQHRCLIANQGAFSCAEPVSPAMLAAAAAATTAGSRLQSPLVRKSSSAATPTDTVAAAGRPMDLVLAASPVAAFGKDKKGDIDDNCTGGRNLKSSPQIHEGDLPLCEPASTGKDVNMRLVDDTPFSALLYMSQVYSQDAESAAHTDMANDVPVGEAVGSDDVERLESLEKDDDFVMIQLKTPFAPPSDAESDLSRFFKSCQMVPDLQMFHRGPAIRDALAHIGDDLSTFESKLPVFDEFVSSLQQMPENLLPAASGRPG